MKKAIFFIIVLSLLTICFFAYILGTTINITHFELFTMCIFEIALFIIPVYSIGAIMNLEY